MKKTLLLLAFHVTFCQAQNLISNSGFELNASIPTGTGQIINCQDWKSSGGSPDYFHQSATVMSGVNIPYSFTGEITAAEGNACVGICTQIENWPNYREYITQKLDAPLVQSKSYILTMEVLTEKVNCIYGGWTSDNFAFALSSKKLHKSPNGIININPTATYPGELYASSWTKIEFNFIADSNYKWITIGCFVHDSLLTLHNTDSAAFINCTYTFIDNVVLKENTSTGLNETEIDGNTKPEYFNILGQPATNVSGLLIKKQGNKYSKVYIHKM